MPVGTLLTEISVKGFRSLRDASFRPGPVTALVGEPGTGKSNLLAAVRAVLDPKGAPLTSDDVTRGRRGPIHITVRTSADRSCTLRAEPPGRPAREGAATPVVAFMPAAMRADSLIAPPVPGGLRQARRRPATPRGDAEAARGLVTLFEQWLERGVTGVVVLVEEPELFLPPQMQRYLYRLLRQLAEQGNQVLYSTHSPSFLNVARLDEIVFTDFDPAAGTTFSQPLPVPPDEEFRASSEFDAARSELFLARAAILVEGQTERLALPFVFQALGYDPDREGISIIECGGKPNIPVIARVARAVGVPFLVVHDRDAPARKKPIPSEQQINRLIAEIAGRDAVELVPDFEGVARLRGRSKQKPARAWHDFARRRAEDFPPQLLRIVERAVAMARNGR